MEGSSESESAEGGELIFFASERQLTFHFSRAVGRVMRNPDESHPIVREKTAISR